MSALRARIALFSDAELLGYLYGLAFAGLEDLRAAKRAGRPYPPLFKAGVRWKREETGKEHWQLPRETYALHEGDCEDLAAGWRVPELWLLGEDGARIFLKVVNPLLRHILVRRADGTIEDPSKILGMGGHG